MRKAVRVQGRVCQIVCERISNNITSLVVICGKGLVPNFHKYFHELKVSENTSMRVRC